MHPLRPHPSATPVTPGSCYWLTSPIRDPIVPPQPDCPKMLMTCCQSAYKQNDMTYSNYRSHRRRNENRGMGERSELREKSLGSRCVLGAPLIKTRTFCLFVMDLFFQDVFLFTGHTSESNLPQSTACRCNSFTFLLLTASMFVLLGR